MTDTLLTELAKAKLAFQQRAILSALGAMDTQCDICGDYDCDNGLPCQTGDGV